MIATHDVELGRAEPGDGAKLKNICFEARIKGDEVYYDYRLRDGIANSMTAAVLMRKLGIISQPPA